MTTGAIPISQLPTAPAAILSDEFVGEQGGTTFAISGAQLVALMAETFLQSTGGVLTGPLTLAADGATALSPVTLEQLQAVAAAGVYSRGAGLALVNKTFSLAAPSVSPSPLASQAAVGSSGTAADAGHVHAMPTAAQVGAAMVDLSNVAAGRVGPGLLGFDSTGASGAAMATGANIQQMANAFVRSLGAKYDGVTDDTAAHQAAINLSASLGVLWHPGSGSSVCGPLSFPSNFKGCVRQPNTSCTLIANSSSPPGNGGPFINISNLSNIWVGGFSVSCNNAVFYTNNCIMVYVNSCSNVFVSVSVSGQFAYGILMQNCTGGGIDKGVVILGYATCFRGIQVSGTTQYATTNVVVDSPTVSGEFTNHLINVQNGSGVRFVTPTVTGPSSTVNTGFGVAIISSQFCSSIGAVCYNTYLEAVQITTSTFCFHDQTNASWDNSHGHDFGCSIDGSNDSAIRYGSFVNSYKACVSLGAGAASSVNIGALFLCGANCGTRAYAANSTASGDNCFFGVGSLSSYTNYQPYFTGCRFLANNAASVASCYYEFGSIVGCVIKDCYYPSFYAAGAAEVLVASSSTLFYDLYVQAFAPTVTSPGNSNFQATPGTSTNYFKRKGDTIWVTFAVTINKSDGSHQAQIACPTPLLGYGGGTLTGRNAGTGTLIDATISGGQITVYNANNGAAAAGDVYEMNGEYLTHSPGN